MPDFGGGREDVELLASLFSSGLSNELLRRAEGRGCELVVNPWARSG